MARVRESVRLKLGEQRVRAVSAARGYCGGAVLGNGGGVFGLCCRVFAFLDSRSGADVEKFPPRCRGLVALIIPVVSAASNKALKPVKGSVYSLTVFPAVALCEVCF